MHKKTSIWPLVLLLLSGISASWSTNAATYSYQSPNYSIIVGNPGLTTSMNVTGSFELEPPLDPNLNNFDLTGLITQYSFNNGVDTFDQSNSVLCTFYVDTNSQGDITEYVVDIREAPAPATGNPIKFLAFYNPGQTGADSGTAPSPGTSCGTISPNHRAYTAAGDYGTWASPAAATPIPALGHFGLIIMASLILFSLILTRKKHRLGSK